METLRIVLSEKVLTGREQILSTLAHEMCHGELVVSSRVHELMSIVACWVISNERKNPHGKVFKSWYVLCLIPKLYTDIITGAARS
jgi:hypothetical protein